MKVDDHPIKAGDSLLIHHYSENKPLKAAVFTSCNEYLVLKGSKNFSTMSYVKGDSVVIQCVCDENFYLITSYLLEANDRDNSILVKLESVHCMDELRKTMSIPVSICANTKLEEKKHCNIVISELSPTDLRFCSCMDLAGYDNLKMEVYFHEKVIHLETYSYFRMQKERGFFEYIAKIMKININDTHFIEHYIKRILAE